MKVHPSAGETSQSKFSVRHHQQYRRGQSAELRALARSMSAGDCPSPHRNTRICRFMAWPPSPRVLFVSDCRHNWTAAVRRVSTWSYHPLAQDWRGIECHASSPLSNRSENENHPSGGSMQSVPRTTPSSIDSMMTPPMANSRRHRWLPSGLSATTSVHVVTRASSPDGVTVQSIPNVSRNRHSSNDDSRTK